MNRLIAVVGVLVAAAAVCLIAGVRLDSARADGAPTVTVIPATPYAFRDSNGNAPADLEVPLGTSVTFVNPTGGGFHDVDFDTLVPSACSGSGSVDSTSASSGPWQGSCTFNTAGTYAFHCSIHFFTGQIVVDGAAGASGPTGDSGSTGASGGGGSAPAGPAGATGGSGTVPAIPAPAPTAPVSAGEGAAPGSGSSGSSGGPTATIASLSAAAVIHGFAVRASARLALRGSTLRASLRYLGSQTLGSVTRRHVGPGRVSFTVALGPRGRKLLRARRTLSVVLTVTVTAPGGSHGTRMRMLKLKAA